MKNPFRSSILPYFTIGAGGLGLCLQLWLHAGTDEKGLLPASHPATVIVFILTALVFAILYLATREVCLPSCSRNFRRMAEGIGSLAGAASLLLHTLSGNQGLLTLTVGAAGCVLLLWWALLAFQKRPLPYGLGAAVTVVLMVSTVTQCRSWGSVPQIQQYFFPLLASLFLILSAYHRTTLAAKHGKRVTLAFFSQGALFLCCVAAGTNPVLYLGMGCWAAAQLLPCYRTKKEN